MWIEVSWPVDEKLFPQVLLLPEFGAFDDARVDIDLARAYAWYDRWTFARAMNRPPPDPSGILLPAQATAWEALSASWPSIVEALGSRFPEEIRPQLRWTRLRLTDREKDRLAYVELAGCVDREDGDGTESGVAAVLHGVAVVAAGDRSLAFALPKPRLAISARPHPDYVPLGAAEIRERIADRDWRGLRERLPTSSTARAEVERQLLDLLLTLPPGQAVALLQNLGPLMPRDAPIPEPVLLSGNPAVLRALTAAALFRVPDDVLFEETDPARIRAWVRLGVDVNHVRRPWGESGPESALRVHAGNAAVFETLLSLGADPEVLRETDRLRVALGPAQERALRAMRPGFLPEASPSEASLDETPLSEG